MKTKMNVKIVAILVVAFCAMFLSNSMKATPSTQIWIPSTDIQVFKTLHLGIDNYIRTQKFNGLRGSGIYCLGLTAGVLPFEKVQAEVGVDYLVMGDSFYDEHPLYFNAKVGTPEGSLFPNSPSFAIGAYNFGTKKDATNYNVFYGLIAKTIPVIGRISAGYYTGNDKLLLDSKGDKSNSGVLLSWDRAMPEISDKLWLAVDYQGGKNYLGALNFGLSWLFSKNVSVIFGYDIYSDDKVLYNSKDGNVQSFTTQLDINF